MKKALFAAIALLLVCAYASADIADLRYKTTASEKEFDVIYYVTPEMNEIKSKINDDVHITQSFEINKNNLSAELRYSLFTDLGGDPQELKFHYAIWVFMCINNIAGFEVSADSISNFKDSDVKNEFNADFGCTAFIINPESDYAKGYTFMMADFFCKEGQGIVMRTFLFNDIDFIGLNEDGSISETSPLFSNYHSFEFMEKDQAGNFYTK